MPPPPPQPLGLPHPQLQAQGTLQSQTSHLAAAPISCNKKLQFIFSCNALPKRNRRNEVSRAACHLSKARGPAVALGRMLHSCIPGAGSSFGTTVCE